MNSKKDDWSFKVMPKILGRAPFIGKKRKNKKVLGRFPFIGHKKGGTIKK